jgi:hypothetical protein
MGESNLRDREIPFESGGELMRFLPVIERESG